MSEKESLYNSITAIYNEINGELTSVGIGNIQLTIPNFGVDFKEISEFIGNFANEVRLKADALIDPENDWECKGDFVNFVTYIFLRYNECVLLDLSGEEEKFQQCLSQLNSSLRSRIIDDSCASEKLFLYVAELNFKVHNYAMALKFLEKSKKLENNKSDDSTNVSLRFHKRCLEAYCYEYSFNVNDYKDNNCSKNNSLIDAVYCLIGRNPKDLVSSKGDFFEDFKRIIRQHNRDKLDVYSIIKQIYKKDTGCLVEKFCNSYSKFLPEKEIDKIVHILAHCFSEIHRWDALSYLKINYESIYLFNMAEILMKSLGDEFITCYATVLLENDQHMLSLKNLIEAREKHKMDWASPQMERELAQIDFYIWYFSVITKKYADHSVIGKLNEYIKKYKANFKSYRDSHPLDSSAATYYELLLMKEDLIKCFSELKSGDLSTDTCNELINNYKNFSDSAPKKNIHLDIKNEWNVIKSGYKIFLSCYRYNATEQPWYLFDIANRLLTQSINNGLVAPKSIAKLKQNKFGRNYQSLSVNQHVFAEITLPFGKFIYIGSDERIIEKMLSELGAEYSVDLFSDNMPKNDIKHSLINIPNVLFLYSDSNKQYLEDLCQYVDEMAENELNEPNVFIYDSALDINHETMQRQIQDNRSQIESLIENRRTFRNMGNLKTVIQYCAIFSGLKACIDRIYKPLNTMVISPIEEVTAYNDQSVEQAIFLKKSEVGTISSASVDSAWKDGVLMCYPNPDKKIKLKCIDLSCLEESVFNSLSAILLIENPKKINLNNLGKSCPNVYTFENFTNRKCYSICTSFTLPYDEQEYGGDIIYSSAFQLWQSRQAARDKKNREKNIGKTHGSNCTHKSAPCCSVFYDDVFDSSDELKSQPQYAFYDNFIDVLYRYNLIKRDTLDKISKNEKNYAITKLKEGIVFCFFKTKTNGGCEKLCKVMCHGITDVIEEDFAPIAESPSETGKEAQESDVVNIAINMVKEWIGKQPKGSRMESAKKLFTRADKEKLKETYPKPQGDKLDAESYNNVLAFLESLIFTFEYEEDIIIAVDLQDQLCDEIKKVCMKITNREIIGAN